MFKRLFLLTMLGTLLSGCFVAPMALIGPATSGFTTASIIQSGVTTGANYLVKKTYFPLNFSKKLNLFEHHSN